MPGIVVIARQRSGTNFLRTLLANSSDLPNLGEVFDHKAGRRDINFHAWREVSGWRGEAPFERAACLAELDGYFDALSQLHPRHIIDVKYNQTLISVPTYQSPADPPPLIEVLMRRGYALVHLVRESVCATIVSDLVAKATGMWHVRLKSDESVPLVRVHVDPKPFIADMQRREREFAMFDALCRPSAKHVRVRYEDIAGADDAVVAPLVRRICELAGATFTGLGQPVFKKGLGHWLDYVENADELVAEMAAVPELRHHVSDLPARRIADTAEGQHV